MWVTESGHWCAMSLREIVCASYCVSLKATRVDDAPRIDSASVTMMARSKMMTNFLHYAARNYLNVHYSTLYIYPLEESLHHHHHHHNNSN